MLQGDKVTVWTLETITATTVVCCANHSHPDTKLHDDCIPTQRSAAEFR